jgi:hypothetical protein
MSVITVFVLQCDQCGVIRGHEDGIHAAENLRSGARLAAWKTVMTLPLVPVAGGNPVADLCADCVEEEWLCAQ